MRKNKNHYPSSQYISDVFLDVYNKLFSIYQKIYDRINITIAACGIVLAVIIENLRTVYIHDNNLTTGCVDILSICVIILSGISCLCVFTSLFILLFLSRGKPIIPVLDWDDIIKVRLYDETIDVASLFIVKRYTSILNDLNKAIQQKQKWLNAAVLIQIIAIFSFFLSFIIRKGL